MKLNIFIMTLVLWSCSGKEANTKTEQIESTVIDDELVTSDSLIYNFNEIKEEFQRKEIGFTFTSNDLSNLKPIGELLYFKSCLKVNLPSSRLKEWICNNINSLGKDDWFQIKPIGRIEFNNIDYYLLTSYEQMSGEGEGYWDYWCLTTADGGSLTQVKHLGTSGLYPRIESGEEDGSEFWIKTIEVEDIQLEFIGPDSIVSHRIAYTLREGHDWRVDQNLKINDSVAAPVVTQVFSVL